MLSIASTASGIAVVSGEVALVGQRLCGGVRVAVYKSGVLVGNGGLCGVPFGIGGDDVDIQFFFNIIGQRDVDAPLVDVGFSALHIGGCGIAEHFQSIGRLAHNRPEGNGDGQPHHSCAGDADAHCIFEDVGTEAGTNSGGQCAQSLGDASCGQRYADGLSATDGRDDLPAHQCEDVLSSVFS